MATRFVREVMCVCERVLLVAFGENSDERTQGSSNTFSHKPVPYSELYWALTVNNSIGSEESSHSTTSSS